MTPSALAALASPDVAVRVFKREHDTLHAIWRRHVDRCPRCRLGGSCERATTLAERADVAGWRWQEAERRALADSRVPEPVRTACLIGLASNLAEEVTPDQITPPVATTELGAGTDIHCLLLDVGVPGSMGIGSPGTCPRATSNEHREAPTRL